MAAPVVSGAVALMLQANPKLTPNMVKMILMYTAQPIAGFNMLEQGAGNLNVEGAVRLAKLVRQDLTNDTPLGTPMLTTANLADAGINDCRTNRQWSQGIMFEQRFCDGNKTDHRLSKSLRQRTFCSAMDFVSDGCFSATACCQATDSL